VVGRFYYWPSDLLGQGSFAEVFEGVSDNGVKVAIKRIHKKKLKKESSKRLLESEVAIMKKLNHPNLVRLLEYLEVADHICLVMEFCDAGDLGIFIIAKAPMKESLIQHITRQIVAGIKYMRAQDIVHRDLKPQNILLCSGEPLIVKIADFGFARHLEDQDMAATFCGSPLYMAPEVLAGNEYNAKADLWSLGAILYQCLTGKAPYRANSLNALKQLLKSNAKLDMSKDVS
jgi:serine/threonine-protein kinase ULK/ATG1